MDAFEKAHAIDMEMISIKRQKIENYGQQTIEEFYKNYQFNKKSRQKKMDSQYGIVHDGDEVLIPEKFRLNRQLQSIFNDDKCKRQASHIPVQRIIKNEEGLQTISLDSLNMYIRNLTEYQLYQMTDKEFNETIYNYIKQKYPQMGKNQVADLTTYEALQFKRKIHKARKQKIKSEAKAKSLGVTVKELPEEEISSVSEDFADTLDSKHKAGLVAAELAFQRKQTQKFTPQASLQKRLTFRAPALPKFEDRPGFGASPKKFVSHLSKIQAGVNEAHYNKLQAQYQDAQKKEGLTPEKQKKLRMIQFQMEKAKKLKEDTPDLNQVQKGQRRDKEKLNFIAIQQKKMKDQLLKNVACCAPNKGSSKEQSTTPVVKLGEVGGIKSSQLASFRDSEAQYEDSRATYLNETNRQKSFNPDENFFSRNSSSELSGVENLSIDSNQKTLNVLSTEYSKMRGRDTSKDTSNVSYKLPRSMVGKKEMSHVIVDEDNALMDPRIMVLQHEIENDPMYKRLHQKNRDKTDRQVRIGDRKEFTAKDVSNKQGQMLYDFQDKLKKPHSNNQRAKSCIQRRQTKSFVPRRAVSRVRSRMGVGTPSMPQSGVKGAKSEMQEVIDYTVHKQYERHKLIYQRVGRPNSEFEDKQGYLKKLEKQIKVQLQDKGMLEEEELVPSVDSNVGLDKFGNPICPLIEAAKEKMIRPRDIEHGKTTGFSGKLSLGEQLVVEQLENLGRRRKKLEKSELLIFYGPQFEVDSLMESAFDTDRNKEWADYQLSARVPQCSEKSSDGIKLVNVDERDDISIGHDQFSDLNDSGSSLSSEYSFRRHCQQENPHSYGDVGQGMCISKFDGHNCLGSIGKYAHFKIVQGLKLPLKMGYQGQRFSIENMIDLSNYMVRKSKRSKKFSLPLLQQIIDTYQHEFNAPPLDLVSGFQISGYLIFQDYQLSKPQLHSLAVTMPYILNLRSINLENCGLKDQELAYVIQGCAKLSKINSLQLGLNTIGPKFVEGMCKEKLLHAKIKSLNLQFMIKSQRYINLLLNDLNKYKHIRSLHLAGNQLSISGAKALTQMIKSTFCLESLNISNCLGESFAAARIIFEGIAFNTTIRYLNLSNNRLNHLEYEFGSRIGRLIQIHRQLTHIDISACKLHKSELIFIVFCIRESKSLSVIHMGHNNIDYYGRLMLRHILNAKVKYPFRAGVKLGQHIKTAEDKQMVIILNSYIMSSLPPLETQHLMLQCNQILPTVKSETNNTEAAMNNLFGPSASQMSQLSPNQPSMIQSQLTKLTNNTILPQKPICNMEDVRQRLMEYRNIQDAKAYSHMGNTGGYNNGQASQSWFSKGPSSPLASPKRGQRVDMKKNQNDTNLTNDMLFEKILKIQEQKTSQSKEPEANAGYRATFGPTGNIVKQPSAVNKKKYDFQNFSLLKEGLKFEPQLRRAEQKKQGEEWLDDYFGMGAEDRVYDMIHFLDIYGRKSNMIKTMETVKKTDKEIMDKINKMYAIEEAKQETRKNAGRHSHGHHHHHKEEHDHHHHEEEKGGGEHKHDDGHVHEEIKEKEDSHHHSRDHHDEQPKSEAAKSVDVEEHDHTHESQDAKSADQGKSNGRHLRPSVAKKNSGLSHLSLGSVRSKLQSSNRRRSSAVSKRSQNSLKLDGAETLRNNGYIVWALESEREKNIRNEQGEIVEFTSKDHVDQHRREIQQVNQLENLMLQSGIKENDLISKIKDVYRWASLISDLDVQIYKDLDKFSPVKITGELIFQRVLNAGVDNCKTWFDTAQCYLCDKHSICTIEMDELKEVLDNEFCEIMQLTNIINQQDQAARIHNKSSPLHLMTNVHSVSKDDVGGMSSQMQQRQHQNMNNLGLGHMQQSQHHPPQTPLFKNDMNGDGTSFPFNLQLCEQGTSGGVNAVITKDLMPQFHDMFQQIPISKQDLTNEAESIAISYPNITQQDDQQSADLHTTKQMRSLSKLQIQKQITQKQKNSRRNPNNMNIVESQGTIDNESENQLEQQSMLSFRFNKQVPQTSNQKFMQIKYVESVTSIDFSTGQNNSPKTNFRQFDLNFHQPLRVQRIQNDAQDEDEESPIEWPKEKADKKENFLNKKFYEFTNYHQSGNIPIKSNIQDRMYSALKEGQVIYNSNIAAKPINVRNLRNHVLPGKNLSSTYNDFVMRQSLQEPEDLSSEEETILTHGTRQKTDQTMTEDNKDELENVLMINFKEGNKKSKKDNRKSKKGVSVRAKTPLNKIVNNPSLKSPTNKEGMKDRRKSAQVNSKPKSQMAAKRITTANPTSKKAKGNKQVSIQPDNLEVTESSMMSIPSTAPRGLESKQTHEDEEETEFTRPETRNLTNMTTNHDNSSILMKDNSNNIMSKDYDISNKSDNAQSLHNLNKVRKIMIDRKKILKSQKRENSKLEEARRVYMERKQRIGVEFRESQQTSKRSSNRFLPENVIAQNNCECEELKKPSAFDALTQTTTNNWFKLKDWGSSTTSSVTGSPNISSRASSKDVAVNKKVCKTMYLMASFNHWFPIRMTRKKHLNRLLENTSISSGQSQSRLVRKPIFQMSDKGSKRRFGDAISNSKTQAARDYQGSYLKRMSTKKLIQENVMIAMASPGQTPSATPAHKAELDTGVKQPAKKESFLKRQAGIAREGRKLIKNYADIVGEKAANEKNEKLAESQEPDHTFCEFLPPGQHYFYFVKDGKFFCLSNRYEVGIFPGTNIRMNIINVEARDFDNFDEGDLVEELSISDQDRSINDNIADNNSFKMEKVAKKESKLLAGGQRSKQNSSKIMDLLTPQGSLDDMQKDVKELVLEENLKTSLSLDSSKSRTSKKELRTPETKGVTSTEKKKLAKKSTGNTFSSQSLGNESDGASLKNRSPDSSNPKCGKVNDKIDLSNKKKTTIKNEKAKNIAKKETLRIQKQGATEEVKKQSRMKTIKLESVDDSPQSDESFKFLLDDKSSHKTGSIKSIKELIVQQPVKNLKLNIADGEVDALKPQLQFSTNVERSPMREKD